MSSVINKYKAQQTQQDNATNQTAQALPQKAIAAVEKPDQNNSAKS